MDEEIPTYRKPGIEKQIAEITGDEGRVRILGTLITKDDTGAVSIDDNTGIINVFFNDFEIVEKLSEISQGDPVRVIGRTNKTPEGDIEIHGETIEKLNNFDFHLWKKIRKLEKEGV